MTDKELFKRLLHALGVSTTPMAKDRQEVLLAMDALRAAIAQPVQPTNDIALQELTCLIRHHTDPEAFQEIRSALNAFANSSQPVQPAPTWKPIDTAPQDDRAVDLWDTWGERHCNMQRVVHSVINIYYAVLPGESGSGCERSIHSGGHITHWMPVPGAPA